MATTITTPTQPKHWIPSGNPIWYNFYTNNTLPNLSYIIDVIINGSTVCQLKYTVYDRSNMSIDFGRIVNDYIKDGWTNDFQGYNPTWGDTLKLELKVYEQNGNNAPVASGFADEVYIWYSVSPFQKSRTPWTYYTYNDLMGNTYDQYGRFLGVHNYCEDVALNSVLYYSPNFVEARDVIFKNLYKISPDTRRSMTFFQTSTYTGGSKHTRIMNCWCYNKHHKLTKQFGMKLHSGTYVDSDIDKKMAAIAVGMQELNALHWTDIQLWDGTLNYIDPSEDKYYFITVSDYSDMASTLLDVEANTPRGNKWVGFEIVPCNQYKVYNILYQTTEGGWWQIRCDRKHQNETKVETNVKYNPWIPVGGGVPLENFDTYKQVMHTNADGSITLNTNWIENQGIISEIEDMIISPRIFLVEDGVTPVYIPVLLKDSTYQIYDKGQDRLFKYEFEFEEGFKKPTLK